MRTKRVVVTLTHELKAGFKTIYIILYIITLDNNFQGHAGFRNYDNHDWSSPRGWLIILLLGKDEPRDRAHQKHNTPALLFIQST